MNETQAAAAEPTQEAPEPAALPLYQSFKQVRAAKIVAATAIPDLGGIELEFEAGVSPRSVAVYPEWLVRRTDTAATGDAGADIEAAIAKARGGYYVVYDNDYASWSPAEAFEAGYAPVIDSPPVGEINVVVDASRMESNALRPIANGHMAETFHANVELFRVERDDAEPGAAYAILCPDQPFDVRWHCIPLQAGPAAEVGANGFTIENLLAIARDRIELWQQTEFRCQANKMAIHYIGGALDALNLRTADRLARGVEGTGVV